MFDNVQCNKGLKTTVAICNEYFDNCNIEYGAVFNKHTGTVMSYMDLYKNHRLLSTKVANTNINEVL